MPKVNLRCHAEYIEAPDFCPYAFPATAMTPRVIHPSMCAICKFCTFVSQASAPQEEPSQADRDVFVEFLTHKNSKISASILAQKQFLGKGDRSMLVILLSPVLVQEMLEASVADEDRRAKLFSYFFNEEVPVCSVLGCPVYVSRKLTKSQVQVVGEIEWR